MFTWGSKFLFGISLAAFGAAVAYGLVTGGGIVGVISMGYKGGVGEHAGYAMLMAAGFSAFFLGVVGVITRDGDAEDLSQRVGAEQALVVKPPVGLSVTSPLAAFGIACLALGLAVSMVFIYLGVLVLTVVGMIWTVQAWAERATGDDEVNAVLRRRVTGPFEVPMLSLVAIAVIVLALSRVLLAVSEIGSVVVAVVAATFVFASAILIAKSSAPRAIISALVSFGAVAVLAGGVIGAAAGERDFHHGEHDDEHSEDESMEGMDE